MVVCAHNGMSCVVIGRCSIAVNDKDTQDSAPEKRDKMSGNMALCTSKMSICCRTDGPLDGEHVLRSSVWVKV